MYDVDMLKIEALTNEGWRDTGIAHDETVVAIIHAHDLMQTTRVRDYRVVTESNEVVYTTEDV